MYIAMRGRRAAPSGTVGLIAAWVRESDGFYYEVRRRGDVIEFGVEFGHPRAGGAGNQASVADLRRNLDGALPTGFREALYAEPGALEALRAALAT